MAPDLVPTELSSRVCSSHVDVACLKVRSNVGALASLLTCYYSRSVVDPWYVA